MKMLMKTMVVVAACAATAVAAPAAFAATAKEEAYIATLQKRVKASLKDPASARFSGSYVSRKAGPPVVCGYVNSRNSLGGYSGDQRFLAAGDIVAIDEQMGRGEMGRLWARFC